MSSDIDKFLDEVDKWKFKLHDKLKRMTAEERAAFWEKTLEKARARGWRIAGEETGGKHKSKRVRRATS